MDGGKLPQGADIEKRRRMFGLKRRIDFHRNEVEKVDQALGATPFQYGDRFIPRRYTSNSYAVSVEREVNDVLMKPENSTWKQSNYIKVLDETFGIRKKKTTSEWSQNRILSFSDELAKFFAGKTEQFYWSPRFHYTLTPHWYRDLDWPCIPRSKPLGYLKTVHSLPGFGRSGKKKLIVWSHADNIVAFVKPEIVTWKPGSPILMVYSLDYITALAYDPTGKLMAAGGKLRNMIVLELWENNRKNIDLKAIAHMGDSSEIQCICWSGNGHHIVSGQKSGNVTISGVANMRTDVLEMPRQHSDPITDIKFSADHKMFSIADASGMVTVWRWHFKTLLFKLKSPIKMTILMDWHPWCSTEFVLAGINPASIGIVNTAEKAVVGWYKQCDRKCIIDAISFSKLSGELVVAYRRMVDGKLKAELVVLASLEHVSDIFYKNKLERIYHLMWSPDGKVLGTAGSNSNLILWDFFGKSEDAFIKCRAERKKPCEDKRKSDFRYFPLTSSLR